MIIGHFREDTLDGGGLLTHAATSEHYLILGAKPLINKYIRTCIKCARYSMKPAFQLTADLHAERVIPSTYTSHKGSEWVKIPSRAPHFGGLWEASVKATKKIYLRRVVGQQEFSNEDLLTVLHFIEAILNSRPLTPLSNDPNDLVPLTPAHFLIGCSFHPMVTADAQMPLNTRYIYNKSRKTFGNKETRLPSDPSSEEEMVQQLSRNESRLPGACSQRQSATILVETGRVIAL